MLYCSSKISSFSKEIKTRIVHLELKVQSCYLKLQTGYDPLERVSGGWKRFQAELWDFTASGGLQDEISLRRDID